MNEGSGLKVGATATWLNSLSHHHHHHHPNSHVEGDQSGMMGFSGQQQQHSHGSTIIDHSASAAAAAGGGGGGGGGQGRGMLDLHSDTANSSELLGSSRSDGDHPHHHHDQQQQQQDNHMVWQNSRLKADVLQHPLYDQLLAAHVACLRIATPVDQLPKIDAQLAQQHHVVAKYSVLGRNQHLTGEDKEELDRFLAQYVLLLSSFKEQLQQHVRVHAMEAVMACWELEQSLHTLTEKTMLWHQRLGDIEEKGLQALHGKGMIIGVSPGEGTGATMSDDEDDQADSDTNLFDLGLDGQDAVGSFGPLIPTENERSLMERVRQELKHELKQGYRSRIEDIREEILRKRRAGKLPGDTTSVLKSWWQAHSKWPYPTEDEKTRLVQETGLQLKQINNWFINQRKRNWHSNPSSSSASNAKRKR